MKFEIEVSEESVRELEQIAIEANTTIGTALENIIHGWTTMRIRGKYENVIRKLAPVQIRELFNNKHAEDVIRDAQVILNRK